jgi:alpha-1,2-glucosyltransferase
VLFLVSTFHEFDASSQLIVPGDKSAHTATIHVPQMLYIWPYIALFSAPLLIGPLFQTVGAVLPGQFRTVSGGSSAASKTSKMLNILISSLFIVGAFLAVHFNTIIHPYTLADNRHYVFYVFRILRLYPAIRYLAVPAYYVCAWLSIEALATPPNGDRAQKQKRENKSPASAEAGCSPCQISFVTIWLVTTTLSVVTAPLVEPRYFIIPWIIWRLHVQSLPASLSTKASLAGKLYDVRIGLETLWVLIIDAAITYVFIYRGFAWPSEPGNIQRFLW